MSFTYKPSSHSGEVEAVAYAQSRGGGSGSSSPKKMDLSLYLKNEYNAGIKSVSGIEKDRNWDWSASGNTITYTSTVALTNEKTVTCGGANTSFGQARFEAGRTAGINSFSHYGKAYLYTTKSNNAIGVYHDWYYK